MMRSQQRQRPTEKSTRYYGPHARRPALSIATEQSICDGDDFMEQMRRAAVMTIAEHRRGNLNKYTRG